MGKLNNFLFFFIILVLIFNLSLEQIIIPLNPINEENGPTVMTRETFTVEGNDGTPIRVTRIGFHRTNKNLNGDGGDKQTPLELMRLMDDRINSIFEEIISQRIGFRLIFNDFINNNEKEEEKEKDKGENKPKEEDKNKENIDEKDFELDEEKKEENIEENKDNNDEEDKNKEKEQNKTEEIKNEENSKTEGKSDINNKNENNKKEKKDKKVDAKKKIFNKLKISPGGLKTKKRKNKLSKKEIIFSRICKYIFYSIILFTVYVLVRKLLELLDIIDPETNIGFKDVKISNNKEEKNNEREIKKKENDIILNKTKENKIN